MITSPCSGTIVISGLSSRARRAATSALGWPPSSLAEQHRPRQVRRLDLVQVDQVDRPQAHQGQVLQDLVAQRAGADDQHPRRRGAAPAATRRSAAAGCTGPGRRSGAGRSRASSRVVRTSIGRSGSDGRPSRSTGSAATRSRDRRRRWLIHRRSRFSPSCADRAHSMKTISSSSPATACRLRLHRRGSAR